MATIAPAQRDDESIPSGPATVAEKAPSPSPPATPWWRTRRSLLAALAVALVGVIALAIGARSTARTAPSALASGATTEPASAVTAEPPPAPSAAAEVQTAEPSTPAPAASPPAPEAKPHKGATVRRAGSANRPPAKLTGPRAFRPTEL